MSIANPDLISLSREVDRCFELWLSSPDDKQLQSRYEDAYQRASKQFTAAIRHYILELDKLAG